LLVHGAGCDGREQDSQGAQVVSWSGNAGKAETERCALLTGSKRISYHFEIRQFILSGFGELNGT
jgi:hypothetical protein